MQVCDYSCFSLLKRIFKKNDEHSPYYIMFSDNSDNTLIWNVVYKGHC